MLRVSRRFIPRSRFNTAQKRSIITADALTALNSYLPAALSTDFIIPIMALTFGVRCALLPIAYWSQRETAKLLPVIPEIQMLSTFYRKVREMDEFEFELASTNTLRQNNFAGLEQATVTRHAWPHREDADVHSGRSGYIESEGREAVGDLRAGVGAGETKNG